MSQNDTEFISNALDFFAAATSNMRMATNVFVISYSKHCCTPTDFAIFPCKLSLRLVFLTYAHSIESFSL